MKNIKLTAGLLICVLAVSLVVPAFATDPAFATENDGPVTNAVPEKIASTPVVVSASSDVRDDDIPVSFVIEESDETGIDPHAVSISKDFTANVGGSWSTSFNTGKIFADDHNAFRTIVSDVSGKYKILITDDKGHEYESPEYSDSGVTVTTTNAWSDRTFTVYILNTGTRTVTGHVKISSYYNQ